MDSVETGLNQIETCIKLGQFSSAKKLFAKISLNSIPRHLSLRASNLARRCDELSKALKILGPIVRDQINVQQSASDNEIADYAYSLCQMGLSLEADKLLAPLRAKGNASALFFSALLSFTQWDYKNARSYLEAFVQCEGVDDYKKMVGRSNLVSSYIFLEEWELAKSILTQVDEFAQTNGFSLLKNLCLEQRAEVCVLTGNFKEAFGLLTTAQENAADSGSRINHWLQKWKVLLQAIEAGAPQGIQLLRDFAMQAQAAGEWETCRDLDFRIAVHFQDKKTAQKLYFGTPYDHYRNRLVDKCNPELPESYIHLLEAPKKDALEYLIDLKQFAIYSDKEVIVTGMTNIEWKLLALLCSDFYRPLKLGELFGKLFEDEFFDPFHSSNRIHQMVSRLNRRFEACQLNIQIKGAKNGYRLNAEAGLAVEVPEVLMPDIDPKLLELTKLVGSNQSLKATDVQQLLDLSARTANRWLKEKVDQNEIEKIGGGKNTRYRLNSITKIAS